MQPTQSSHMACGVQYLQKYNSAQADYEERERNRRELSQLHKELEKLRMMNLCKDEEIEARNQKIAHLEARVRDLESKIDNLNLEVTSLTRELQAERLMRMKNQPQPMHDELEEKQPTL